MFKSIVGCEVKQNLHDGRSEMEYLACVPYLNRTNNKTEKDAGNCFSINAQIIFTFSLMSG